MQAPPLDYFAGDNPIPLPDWAKFLLNIGIKIAERQSEDSKLIVALALPTRAFASVLIATGIALKKSTIPVSFNADPGYFKFLGEQPPGTRAFWLRGHKRLKIILEGTTEMNGQTLLRIQSCGNLRNHFINEALAKDIELDSWEGVLPETQKGKTVLNPPEFLQFVMCEQDSREFVTKTRLEAIIVGAISSVQAEIDKTRLCATTLNGLRVEGTFLDLLRVKRFMPGQAFRTEVLSDTANDLEFAPEHKDIAIIFDGPKAFLKWRERFRIHNWAIVLDRSHPSFRDAADVLNQEFMQFRQGDFTADLTEPEMPWGVEIMGFEEAVA